MWLGVMKGVGENGKKVTLECEGSGWWCEVVDGVHRTATSRCLRSAMTESLQRWMGILLTVTIAGGMGEMSCRM